MVGAALAGREALSAACAGRSPSSHRGRTDRASAGHLAADAAGAEQTRGVPGWEAARGDDAAGVD